MSDYCSYDWATDDESVCDLSPRDYFAAKALPAVIAAYFQFNGACFGHEHLLNNCAAHAYKFADAMLAERAK